MSKKVDLSNSYMVEVLDAYDKGTINNVVSIELEDIAKPTFKVNEDGLQYTAGYKKLKLTTQKTIYPIASIDPVKDAKISTGVREFELTPGATITLISENEGKEESVEDLKDLLNSIFDSADEDVKKA